VGYHFHITFFLGQCVSDFFLLLSSFFDGQTVWSLWWCHQRATFYSTQVFCSHFFFFGGGGGCCFVCFLSVCIVMDLVLAGWI
jgi:hypothetical protein